MGSTLPEEGDVEIAIIGGGIAGITLALGLLSRNIKTRIYERGQSFREIGAGIGFTPNAEWAMKVLDPRIHAAFKQVASPNATDDFLWVDGYSKDSADPNSMDEELIYSMYLGERGFEGCHRADFLDEIVKTMPKDTVKFDKNLDSIVEDENSETVILNFRDGSTEKADTVIGCDGIRSRVRQLILGADHPASYPGYSHKYAFRGLVPMAEAKKALGEEKTQTRHMHLGQDAHALTFPVAGGALLNVVAFVTDSEDWPFKDKLTAPASKEDAVRFFADFNPCVRAIMNLLPDKLDKWAVFDVHDQPITSYVSKGGRVCISGDAAHAAAPYHGAGAGFCIEDACVLARLIEDAATQAIPSKLAKSARLRAALQTFDAVRLERTRWLVESSRFVGEMYEWRDNEIGSDREKCGKEIDWRSHKIWDYNIDDMMKEALKVYTEKLQA